jgi:hypothetical protein
MQRHILAGQAQMAGSTRLATDFSIAGKVGARFRLTTNGAHPFAVSFRPCSLFAFVLVSHASTGFADMGFLVSVATRELGTPFGNATNGAL